MDIDLKGLLTSDNLNEFFIYSTTAVNETLLFNAFEPRMLNETKQLNENKSISKSKMVQPTNITIRATDKISYLENKLALLNHIYQEKKEMSTEKCETLLNQLNNCLIVYSK